MDHDTRAMLDTLETGQELLIGLADTLAAMAEPLYEGRQDPDDVDALADEFLDRWRAVVGWIKKFCQPSDEE